MMHESLDLPNLRQLKHQMCDLGQHSLAASEHSKRPGQLAEEKARRSGQMRKGLVYYLRVQAGLHWTHTINEL